MKLLGTYVACGAGGLLLAVLLAGCAGQSQLEPRGDASAAAAPRRDVSARDLLYVSDYLENEIFVFSASEKAGNAAPLQTIDVGTTPQGLWVDKKGVLYAVVGKSVEEFKPHAAAPFLTITDGLDDPIAVAVDQNETVYVSDEEGKSVGILEYPAGTTSPSLTISLTEPKTLFAFTGGMAFDPRGNLYATTFFYNLPPAHVFEIPAGTSKATDLGLDGVGNEAGVAADAAGNLYVTNEESGINVYAPGKTEPSRTITLSNDGPSLFAVTRSGELYVPFQYSNFGSLLEFAKGGDAPVNTITGTYLHEPVGAALAKESL